MFKIEVFSIDFGTYKLKQVDSLDINNIKTFRPSYSTIYETVRWYRSKKRKAFPHALTKGEVSYTNKKPFNQKGRGVARQGSLKNPHQRGGGCAFPPRKNEYSFKMNKKKIALSLISMISIRINEGRLMVVDSLNVNSISTNLISEFIKSLSSKKVLFVDFNNPTLRLSTRNLRSTKYLQLDGLNTMDVINFSYIIFTKESFKKFLQGLSI